ncbi:hypothetical protein D3C83_169070 [compost metagenome]
MVVAGVRNHQLVADIARAGLEQPLLLEREDLGVEVPGDRQVGRRRTHLRKPRTIHHFVVKLLEKQYLTKR